MTVLVRPALIIASLAVLTACKDDNNRVISQHVTPAGHSFTLMPITEQGVTDITISAAWASDWLLKPGGNEWVPSLGTELMLTGGTLDLAPADLADLLDSKNSYGNLYLTSDYIYGEVEYPNNYSNAVLPVLADMFQRPNFDETEFERIKAQVTQTVTQQDRPVGQLMWETSRVALFGNGPQSAYLNGSGFDDLADATLEDVRTWHAESFAHRPSVIVVTGAVVAEDAAKAIDTLLPAPGDVPIDPASLLPSPRFTSQTIYLHIPDAEKSTLAFIGPLPNVTGPEATVDLPIIHLLGGGADNPLFTAIREELGATYGMGVELAAYSRSQRVLAIHGEIDTEKMPAARDAVLETYAAFRAAPDTTRLSNITTHLADEVRQDNIYVSSSAATIREMLLQGGDPEDYHSLPDDLLAITPGDVQARLAQAFPASDNLAIFAAGPDPDSFPEACVITAPAQAVDC